MVCPSSGAFIASTTWSIPPALTRPPSPLRRPALGPNGAAPDAAACSYAPSPAYISPLVAYLATADCPFTGGVFHVMGNEVALFEGWKVQDRIHCDDGRWSVAGLAAEAKKLLDGRPALASQGTDMTDLIGNMLGGPA